MPGLRIPSPLRSAELSGCDGRARDGASLQRGCTCPGGNGLGRADPDYVKQLTRKGCGALRTTELESNRSDRCPGRPRKASLLRLWLGFKHLTEFAFPRRFPIVQFPNLPLIVALLAGATGAFLDGSEHSYAASVSYLALTIWAYEELVHGVNWFRRLLGLIFLILLIMRVAHAVRH